MNETPEEQSYRALESRVSSLTARTVDHPEKEEETTLPVPQPAFGKAFARSVRSRSYLPRSEAAPVEAIDDESSDEDTKPVIQSQFQAFQHPRRSASNAMGSRQWYSGVYAEKRRQEEELAEEEKLAEEAARAGVESVS